VIGAARLKSAARPTSASASARDAALEAVAL